MIYETITTFSASQFAEPINVVSLASISVSKISSSTKGLHHARASKAKVRIGRPNSGISW